MDVVALFWHLPTDAHLQPAFSLFSFRLINFIIVKNQSAATFPKLYSKRSIHSLLSVSHFPFFSPPSTLSQGDEKFIRSARFVHACFEKKAKSTKNASPLKFEKKMQR
jgi:hypothetical protein